MSGLGRKKPSNENFPRNGKGVSKEEQGTMDTAKVGRWTYYGKVQPLEGGTGMFHYTDSDGKKHSTLNFTIGRRKRK